MHEPTRILIVDDEPLVRRSLKRILERGNYVCDQASTVEEAKEYLDENSVPLVLSDIRMPGTSGLQLVEYISELEPDTVILTITAVDNTTIAVDALSRGAYAYIIKPFEPNEIQIQVRYALRRRELELKHRERERELREKVREQTEKVRKSREEIALRLITASQYRDCETGAHIRRIGLYAEKMAKLLGWSDELCDLIRVAAPMHDIGKLGIPDKILLKEGELTSEEWEIMKRHTTIGARILEDSDSRLISMARTIALQHHEKWDGSGYPHGLSGEDISLAARIVAVADVFDALTHDRVYRSAWPEERAIDHLRDQRGTHFEPDLVDLFLDNLDDMSEIREADANSMPELASTWQKPDSLVNGEVDSFKDFTDCDAFGDTGSLDEPTDVDDSSPTDSSLSEKTELD